MTAAEKRALATRLRALALVPTQGGHNADRALLLRAWLAGDMERRADAARRRSDERK